MEGDYFFQSPVNAIWPLPMTHVFNGSRMASAFQKVFSLLCSHAWEKFTICDTQVLRSNYSLVHGLQNGYYIWRHNKYIKWVLVALDYNSRYSEGQGRRIQVQDQSDKESDLKSSLGNLKRLSQNDKGWEKSSVVEYLSYMWEAHEVLLLTEGLQAVNGY